MEGIIMDIIGARECSNSIVLITGNALQHVTNQQVTFPSTVARYSFATSQPLTPLVTIPSFQLTSPAMTLVAIHS